MHIKTPQNVHGISREIDLLEIPTVYVEGKSKMLSLANMAFAKYNKLYFLGMV